MRKDRTEGPEALERAARVARDEGDYQHADELERRARKGEWVMAFERSGFLFHAFEEWSQFFHACNWYTIHPIMLEIENDEVLGGIEFTLIVLGVGFRVRWNHTETDEMREILRRVDEVEKSLERDRP